MKTQIFLLFSALISIFWTVKVFAQDEEEPSYSKVREVGIGLYSLNSFSLQYRWGFEPRLFRISGNLSGTTSDRNSTDNSTIVRDSTTGASIETENTVSPINLSCGVNFSILKIKPITEKFEIMYGSLIALTYSIYESKTETSTKNAGAYYSNSSTRKGKSETHSQAIRPSIGFAFGAVYEINPSFRIYAEIDPNIFYSYERTVRKYSFEINGTNYSETGNSPSSSNSFGLSNLSNSGASLTFVYRISR